MKFVIDKSAWEALDPALQALYVEKDGAYHLQVEGEIPGMVPKGKLDEFRDNNIRLAKKAEEAEAKAKELEELGDLDEVRAAIKASRDAKNKRLLDEGKVEELIKERTATMAREHQEQVTKLQGENEAQGKQIAGLKERLAQVVIDGAVMDALVKKVEKVPASAAKLARIEARQILFLDDDGQIIAKDKEGNTKHHYGSGGKQEAYGPEHFVDDFVATYAQDYWPSRGSGAPKPGSGGGAAGKNPWMSGDGFNLTEQGRLIREEPDRARRLAKEAGVDPTW